MVVYRLSLVNIPVDTGSTPCITIANLNSLHSRFSNIVNDSEVTVLDQEICVTDPY